MFESQTITPRLIKPGEAAAYIAVSERMLWGLSKAGTIRAVQIGRAVRYDVRDLDKFIEQSKNRGGR